MGIKYQHQNNGNILYDFFDVDWVHMHDDPLQVIALC
jgi:hypothetical protein